MQAANRRWYERQMTGERYVRKLNTNNARKRAQADALDAARQEDLRRGTS